MENIFNDSGQLIFCAIVLAIIAETMVGLFLFMKAKSFMAVAVTTMATVIKVTARGNGNGSTYYQMDLKYKDGMGNEHNSKISQGQELKEGDQVEILYDPNHPEKAKPNNPKQIFILPIAFMASIMPMGMVLAIMVMQGVAKVPF